MIQIHRLLPAIRCTDRTSRKARQEAKRPVDRCAAGSRSRDRIQHGSHYERFNLEHEARAPAPLACVVQILCESVSVLDRKTDADEMMRGSMNPGSLVPCSKVRLPCLPLMTAAVYRWLLDSMVRHRFRRQGRLASDGGLGRCRCLISDVRRLCTHVYGSIADVSSARTHAAATAHFARRSHASTSALVHGQ
jgi:hypothetical protein